ncbi:hypothetical protein [Aristaeella hokkaidonensis]|uniref:Uncharacterized protein n=2 Tax=Aristaeella hokkaidonensis TaxID=3046382 RepID=A0AC61N091_9FIRM|nr:hypothetical protein [Aristaeella hokkaidonensis]QUC66029.1 hypothetical protein JYE49_09110 [Aristaeella hokkaidonensis]SNT93744.1 hypothetical protein SAMN06297421_10367 [Aristaeella hokkaidonensis]
MNHIRSFLCFLLLMGMLLSAHLPSAGASSFVPEWDHVQRKLDCQGQKIVIDAITDTNLPETVCEYDASLRVMSEEKLRALVSVAAPGYENIPFIGLHAPGDDDGWVLEDEEAGIMAVPGNAFGVERYHETRDRFTVGTVFGFSHFYKEPIDPNAVANLKELSYPDALKLLAPVLARTELSLGNPQFVKVYDLDTLVSNQKTYNETFNEHHDYTWEAGDEVYEIQFPVYWQGLRLHTQGGYVVGNKSTAYPAMKIILQADGTLLQVYVSDPIDTPVAAGPEAKPLSLEQILDVYAQFLSSYALPDYVEPRVSRISLEYLVWEDYIGFHPTYHLVPVWCFYMPYTDSIVTPEYNYIQYFNAVTGEYLNRD